MFTLEQEVKKMTAYASTNMSSSNCAFAAGTSVRARILMDTALLAVSILICCLIRVLLIGV